MKSKQNETNIHPITILEPPTGFLARWANLIHGLILIMTPILIPALFITLAK